MKTFDRRKFFVLLSSAGLLSACGVKSKLLDTVLIDDQVQNTLQFLHNKWPEIKELSNKAVGLLVIPKVSEASLVYGGSYGKGALLIEGKPIDYYSFVGGSWGLNFGVQQY
ncbi:MAG: twin-arginine translocation pathway signal, partial [Rhodobacteraceae bacterium]|nr:twin-arginine translocation pathway signal [Paracoccaceae bacterium]